MMYQKQLGKTFNHSSYATGINAWIASPGATLEQYRAMTFDQGVPGASVDIGVPSDTSVLFSIDFSNMGTQDIGVVSGPTTIVVKSKTTVRASWDGVTFREAPPATTTAIPVDGFAVSTLALPAATGGGALRFYVNKDVSGPVTLTVPVGDYLNDVLNGTFLFTNYPVGTQFVATDYAFGKWVIAVEGASTQTALSYGRAAWIGTTVDGTSFTSVGTSASNTLIAGTASRFPFGSAIKAADGITLDNINSQFVVTKSGRYSINATVAPTTSAATGWLQIVKNDTALLGVNSVFNPVFSGFKLESETSWVGELTAGDRIDARYASGHAIGAANITIIQLAAESAVLAGMVTPTKLNVINVRTFGTGKDISAAGGFMSFNDPDLVIYNPNGMVHSSGNQLQIPEDGVYRIACHASFNNNLAGNNLSILINGVTTATAVAQDDAGNIHGTNVEFVGPLLKNDLVTVINQLPAAAASSWRNPFVTIQQLPTSSIVANQDLVPVENLHWARWQLAFPAASTTFAVPPGTNMMPLLFAGIQDGFGVVTDATNIVCAQAGRYRFDWLLMAPSSEFNDDGEVHIVVNGVSVASVPYDMNQASAVNQTTGTLTVDLAVNDLVQLRYAGSPTADAIIWSKGTYLHVQQIATMSILNPANVPVIDDDTFATALSTNVPSAESVKAYVDAHAAAIPSNVKTFLWAGGGFPASEVWAGGNLSFYYGSTASGGQITAHNRTGNVITLNWQGWTAGVGSLNQKSGSGALSANGNLSIGPSAMAVNQHHMNFVTTSEGEMYRVTAQSGQGTTGVTGNMFLMVEKLA